MHLKASEKNRRDKANVYTVTLIPGQRNQQVSDCKAIILQCKSVVSIQYCWTTVTQLVNGAYSDNSMAYGWFVIRRLKDESFPEVGSEKAW